MSVSTYGRPTLGEGWFSLFDQDLMNLNQATMRMEALYRKGTGLSSIGAELHPDTFSQASGSDTEARLRASYWLYVGARVLLAQGRTAAAAALADKAGKLQDKAALGILVPGGESNLNVRRIPNEAAQLAQANGMPEIASVLLGQTDKKQVAAAIETHKEELPETQLSNLLSGKDRKGNRPWGLYVLGTLVLTGALLYLGRPYIEVASRALPPRPPGNG